MDYYEILASVDNRRSSRYRKCRLLRDLETGDSLKETRDLYDIPYNNSDMFHTVTTNEASRLDLIAHQYYNNALMWWVIAEANNIADPTEPIETGTTLRIPTIESLYIQNGPLS